jgi:hypothetical protein
VAPLTQQQAYARLQAAGANGGEASGEVGDVAAARRAIAEKALVGGRIAPGDSREGFVYFELGAYERARLSMTDIATGESEGFVVDF